MREEEGKEEREREKRRRKRERRERVSIGENKEREISCLVEEGVKMAPNGKYKSQQDCNTPSPIWSHLNNKQHCLNENKMQKQGTKQIKEQKWEWGP